MKRIFIILFLSVSFSHGMSWVFSQKPPKAESRAMMWYPYFAVGVGITASLLTDCLTIPKDNAFRDVCEAINDDKHMVAIFERRLRCLADLDNYEFDLDRISADQMKKIYTSKTFSRFQNEIDRNNRYALSVPEYLTEQYRTDFSVINRFKVPKESKFEGYYFKKAEQIKLFQRTAHNVLIFVKGT